MIYKLTIPLKGIKYYSPHFTDKKTSLKKSKQLTQARINADSKTPVATHHHLISSSFLKSMIIKELFGNGLNGHTMIVSNHSKIFFQENSTFLSLFMHSGNKHSRSAYCSGPRTSPGSGVVQTKAGFQGPGEAHAEVDNLKSGSRAPFQRGSQGMATGTQRSTSPFLQKNPASDVNLDSTRLKAGWRFSSRNSSETLT